MFLVWSSGSPFLPRRKPNRGGILDLRTLIRSQGGTTGCLSGFHLHPGNQQILVIHNPHVLSSFLETPHQIIPSILQLLERISKDLRRNLKDNVGSIRIVNGLLSNLALDVSQYGTHRCHSLFTAVLLFRPYVTSRPHLYFPQDRNVSRNCTRRRRRAWVSFGRSSSEVGSVSGNGVSSGNLGSQYWIDSGNRISIPNSTCRHSEALPGSQSGRYCSLHSVDPVVGSAPHERIVVDGCL